MARHHYRGERRHGRRRGQPLLSGLLDSSEFFRESDQHTHCPWKGEASYYDITVDGAINEGAAWYYPAPKEAATNIKGRVAFWKGVVVE